MVKTGVNLASMVRCLNERNKGEAQQFRAEQRGRKYSTLDAA